METHSEILAILWTSLGSTCSQGVVLVNGAQSTSLSHGGRTPARGRAVTLDSQVSPGECGFAHAVLGPVSQLSCICGGQSEDRVVQKVKQAFPENRQVLEGAAGHLTWFLPIFQPFLALAGRATEAWPRASNRPLTLGSPPQAHLTPRRPHVLEAATETPPPSIRWGAGDVPITMLRHPVEPFLFLRLRQEASPRGSTGGSV